jgi:phosphopantetheine adenylyltransferase
MHSINQKSHHCDSDVPVLVLRSQYDNRYELEQLCIWKYLRSAIEKLFLMPDIQ